ncbi:MAG: PD-(D/E)XK nuclease family transposase [Lachnospiraceae bacterium]|nr:PD-(D/E)XK nuclease family transposase [Lachnospiraceae bacterium]
MQERSMLSEQELLENLDFNLSDFALFLSVMKNKEAHEAILSMIMEDPELKLKDVHVEQVILNRSGKRAIRLDAWAVDANERQFNTEMQNDTEHDDVRKRSRFYQGLIDTPVLKAGKETRYRNLPSTVIIFITREDIFGRDLAKYTFTEQCEEIQGLHLEDGTKKIFLNMTSKNGSPEVISLLQYMKETRLNNPDILVRDQRLLTLDSVVTEVKQSEEWEDVKMSILSIGMEKGEEIGKEIGKEIGRAEARRGMADIIISFLSDFGTVPGDLEERIRAEKDLEILSVWIKKAARSESIDEFRKNTVESDTSASQLTLP